MRTEIIKIQDTEYKLKMGFGVMMLFEDEENKSITEAAGKNDIMKLAYYALKYNNEDVFKWSYKEFVDDILDENPGTFIQIIEIISTLLFGEESTGEKKSPK